MSEKPSIKGSPSKPSRKFDSPPTIPPVSPQSEFPSRQDAHTIPFGLKLAAGIAFLTLLLIAWVGAHSKTEKARGQTQAQQTENLVQKDELRAKGIATSIAIYATDYDQIFPPFAMWEQRLEPYLKEPSTVVTLNPDVRSEPFVYPAEFASRSTTQFEATELPLVYGKSPWKADGNHTIATVGLDSRRVTSTELESLLRDLRRQIQVPAAGSPSVSRLKVFEDFARKMTYMTVSEEDFEALPPQDARYVRNCFWALQQGTFEEEKLLGFTKDYSWELAPNGSEAALPVFQQENLRRLKAHAQKGNK